MSTPLLLAALMLLTANVANAGLNPDVCLPININTGKNFPIIPNDFHAIMQWNMMTVNQTYMIDEIFASDANIGVMMIYGLITSTSRTMMLTNGATGEFFMIEDYDGAYGRKCDAGPLTGSDFTFPFKKLPNGGDLLLSGRDVLLLGANNAALGYVGTDVIDDIEVDVWNGCLFIQETDTTLNATYYFTMNATGAKSWKTASGYPVVPKRVAVFGKDSNGKDVDQVYEYVLFNTEIPMDPEYYETPLGSYCEGRKNTKKLPAVPYYFKFYMEAHEIETGVATYFDEYYDFASNYTRMDKNIRTQRDNVSEVVTLIHDFNSGVAYQILKYSGECIIHPIKAEQFDDMVIGAEEGKIRMRTPKEFFNFDNNDKYPWIYEGTDFINLKQNPRENLKMKTTHFIRDIQTEVYISKRPFPTEDSSVIGYWEWYFTAAGIVINNGDVEEYLEPFKLVLNVPDFNKKTEYSIYMFNQEPPDTHYFDIKDCYDMNNESRAYEFVMRADVRRYDLDNNVGSLKYWVAFAVEAFAGVRSIRITDIEFMFTVTRVYVRFRILDKPNVQGSVEHPATLISLDDAEAYLVSSIENEQFAVFYVNKLSQEVSFSVVPDSFRRQTEASKPSFYNINDDGGDGAVTTFAAAVPSGGAVALAIVMLLVGVAIIAIPFYMLVVRKKQDLTAYQNSRLTMNDM